MSIDKIKSLLERIDLDLHHGVLHAARVIETLSTLNWRLFLTKRRVDNEDLGETATIQQQMRFASEALDKLTKDMNIIKLHVDKALGESIADETKNK